jgi:hypothetical protein
MELDHDPNSCVALFIESLNSAFGWKIVYDTGQTHAAPNID